ncbi:OprD family porin [Pseudomonas asiatica]|uniref:OprD family porin n=1 Tax=Pseudomonas asiatica TaxID=2219225 RepID=UPI00383A04C7
MAIASSMVWGAHASAAFVQDSKASLDITNYYFNSDYRDEVSSSANQQSKREEWAQGFTLRFDSGFTGGRVGFGVDAIGMLGFKLDSGPERSNTGLLQQDAEAEPGKPSYAKRAQDSYSRLALTGKAKIAETELRIGTLIPELPVVNANTSRLFPTTYQGVQAASSDIKDLKLIGGVINRAQDRNSQDYEPMTVDSRNSRFVVTGESDRFFYGGAQYNLTPSLVASYYYGELQDFYTQHYFGLRYSVPVGPGKLGAEARYFLSRDSGARFAGEIDNKALAGKLDYSLGGAKVSVGYQTLSGDTAFAFIDGTNTMLFTEVQVSNFSEAEEKTTFARFDYDFAALGIPGLSFMTRYLTGRDADVRNRSGGSTEWERNTDIAYFFQKGSALKNFSVRLRNATYRSDFQRDVDQNRLILTYSLPIM